MSKVHSLLVVGAVSVACGGAVESPGDAAGGRYGGGGGGGSAGAAGGPGGSGGVAGGQLGGSGGASGTGGVPPASEDCGFGEESLTDIPELHSDELWLMAVSVALTPTTLYVGFHDGMHYGVDRIYAVPRCGGPASLIASELGFLAPSALSAASGVAYAVDAGAGASEESGSLLHLQPTGVDIVASGLHFPSAVHAVGDEVYVLDSPRLLRFSGGGVTTVADGLDGSSTALTVDGQYAYVGGPGGPVRRVDLATGTRTDVAAVPTHQLAQDETRLFACALLDAGPVAVAIDKGDGHLTELGGIDECSIPVVVREASLFVGAEIAGIVQFDLTTLQPVGKWPIGAHAIAVDEFHVFGAAHITIRRGHR